jgi:hypothetical protein
MVKALTRISSLVVKILGFPAYFISKLLHCTNGNTMLMALTKFSCFVVKVLGFTGYQSSPISSNSSTEVPKITCEWEIFLLLEGGT